MGLLDSNKVLTTPNTGLEGSPFNLLVSNDKVDIWEYADKNTQKELRVTFRDVFVWSESDKLYMVKGKITDEPIVLEVNDINFPNLRHINNDSSKGFPSIVKVIACPAQFCYSNSKQYGNVTSIYGKDFRVCVIFDNGQIYHNFPSFRNDSDFYNDVWAKIGTGAVKIEALFDKFDESVVWDLPGRKHPVKTTTGDDAALIATGAYYYNPALPDNCYEFHPALNSPNGYGNTDGFGATNNVNNVSNGKNIGLRSRFWRPNMDDTFCNSFFYMGGFVTDNLFTMIGTYRSNTTTHPCRMCVFGTQDGGRTWYAMYEFANQERVKMGSTYQSADATIGIILAQEGNASANIYNVKRRSIIVPSGTDKEPSTLFEYGNAINISSIVGTTSGIIVTTESAHGFSKGDTIVIGLQENVSLDGRVFDWLVNSNADGTTSGNGVLFKVGNVTSTTFVLTMYINNPDSNLPVRHIHALNKCKDGVSVSCGEQYPCGWILYHAIKEADAFAAYNVADTDKNIFVRLTSTADSFQRPLGFVLQQEGKDTYCYIGSDNEFTLMNDVTMPEGRTNTFKHNSCGVWKVKLDEIDSHKDNGLILYNARQVAYGFQQMGNALVFVGQFGDLAISFDKGETWTEIQLPGSHIGACNFSGMTYDNKFSINNVLIQLKR